MLKSVNFPESDAISSGVTIMIVMDIDSTMYPYGKQLITQLIWYSKGISRYISHSNVKYKSIILLEDTIVGIWLEICRAIIFLKKEK